MFSILVSTQLVFIHAINKSTWSKFLYNNLIDLTNEFYSKIILVIYLIYLSIYVKTPKKC